MKEVRCPTALFSDAEQKCLCKKEEVNRKKIENQAVTL
jgi:hypothetical protein